MRAPQILQLLDQRLDADGVRATDAAKALVVAAIEAIETDPNPQWTRGPTKPVNDIQADIIPVVSYKMLVLHQRLIRTTNNQVSTISAFHVLHHLSRWTDDLCPFEKPGNP